MKEKQPLTAAARKGADCQQCLLRMRRLASPVMDECFLNELEEALSSLDSSLYYIEESAGYRASARRCASLCLEYVELLRGSMEACGRTPDGNLRESFRHAEESLEHLTAIMSEFQALFDANG